MIAVVDKIYEFIVSILACMFRISTVKTNDCIDCLIRGWTPLFIHNEVVHRHPLGGVMSIRKETPPHSEKVSLP
jgi:hypothetical protein